MRCRILCFLCAFLIVLGSIVSSLPIRASAMVPVGLVQSALASYIASTGYKLWNENGTGDQLLTALSDLYDGPFLAYAESVLGVNIEVNDLSYYASNDMVYLDNNSQIVVRRAAADMFQEFADWIQTEYSVPIGSDSPTDVVPSSGAMYSNSSGTIMALVVSMDGPSFVDGSQVFYTSSNSIGTIRISGTDYPCYYCNTSTSAVYLTQYVSSRYIDIYRAGSISSDAICFNRNGSWSKFGIASITQDFVFEASSYQNTVLVSCSLPVSSVKPSNVLVSELNKVEGTGVVGMGVTLAQAVTDVIGQANEDDAVVIGVGASVGATAQDIADLVAQGVKAQTLDPSVSITAESVIDTPVQPYPDIDGLGLPQLGAALVERFPFCIPWDFVDTVQLLSADPVAPNIAVDLFPAGFKSKVGVTGSTEFRINLGDEKYAKIGVFCRWGSLIGFCFGLAMLTKRMIWTA